MGTKPGTWGAALLLCAAAGCGTTGAAESEPVAAAAPEPSPGVANPAPSAGAAEPAVPAPAPAAPAQTAPAAETAPAPAEIPKAAVTEFEESPRQRSAQPGVLATIGYPVTEKERPHFERLAGDNPFLRGAVSSLDGDVGAWVGWFGIVRGIREDGSRRETRLYLESKYFDGATDSHILCLNFNGGGDFVAVLGGTGHPVQPLALVRVYGTLSSRKDGLPRVEVQYVRHWDWGRFTFMFAQGPQIGSERWRRLAKPGSVDDDSLYEPFPDPEYFIDRLGPRSSFLTERPDIPTED